jgi:hypothetical protein
MGQLWPLVTIKALIFKMQSPSLTIAYSTLISPDFIFHSKLTLKLSAYVSTFVKERTTPSMDVKVIPLKFKFHTPFKPIWLSSETLESGSPWNNTHTIDKYFVDLFKTLPHHRLDNGGSKYLWNVGKLLPDYTVLQLRRQPSSLHIHLEDGNCNICQNVG